MFFICFYWSAQICYIACLPLSCRQDYMYWSSHQKYHFKIPDVIYVLAALRWLFLLKHCNNPPMPRYSRDHTLVLNIMGYVLVLYCDLIRSCTPPVRPSKVSDNSWGKQRHRVIRYCTRSPLQFYFPSVFPVRPIIFHVSISMIWGCFISKTVLADTFSSSEKMWNFAVNIAISLILKIRKSPVFLTNFLIPYVFPESLQSYPYVLGWLALIYIKLYLIDLYVLEGLFESCKICI